MSKRTRNSERNSEINLDDLSTGLKIIVAKNPEQQIMMDAIESSMITFVKGAAGSGKTLIAIHYAMREFVNKRCEKIVLTRPVVEAAGERIGFLPGDISDKIDPYMLPIFELLSQIVAPDLIPKLLKNGKDSVIRVIPLAFMRGLSFKDSVVICDEAQNTTPDQLRMLLTRIGENSKMILCGDIRQSDIERQNGLEDAFDLLTDIEGIGFVTLTANAIVRHPVIGKIEERYEQRARTGVSKRKK